MPKDYISRSIRDLVFDRAKGCCEYCLSQQEFSMDTFAIEHIYPRSKGGSNALENLALSCQGCNSCKHTYTEAPDPQTNQTAPLYNPRIHIWDQHFTWSNDYRDIIGRTPIGRASVEKLQLNRPGNQNLRRVLHQSGDHPPNR